MAKTVLKVVSKHPTRLKAEAAGKKLRRTGPKGRHYLIRKGSGRQGVEYSVVEGRVV